MLILVTGVILIIVLIPLLEDRTKIGRLLNLMSDEQIELISKERKIRSERGGSEFMHGRLEVYGMALKNFSEARDFFACFETASIAINGYGRQLYRP